MSTMLAPSILSADFGHLARDVQEVEAAGVEWIHIDVMDGHFVPNITLGPAITAAAGAATTLPLDVHLMIENPERYLEDFAAAGAAVITVHHEACRHLHRTVQQIHGLGLKAGVAINPATPVEMLTDIVADLDLLLIMSVNPGFGGQAFIPSSIERVQAAREMIEASGSTALIEVDGGVGPDNAGELAASGADVLVAGSAIFRHAEGATAGVRALRGALANQ